MFRLSTIIVIKFGAITNSLLTKNQLFFSSNSYSEINKLIVLQFDVYYVCLTEQTMDKRLFKNVCELKIYYVLKRISFDLFVYFEHLKNIDLQLDNLKEFLHADTKWMSTLNWYTNIDPYNISKVRENLNSLMRVKFQFLKRYVSFDVIYEYPDEDICLFRDFPHNHMVYPILRPGKQLKCTCTIAWLQMYAYLYEPVVNLTDNYNLNYQNDHQFLLKLNYTFLFCSDDFRCDFKRLLNNCDRFSFQMASNSLKLNNDVDVYFLIKWLQFILLTILQPIFALLGIINNLLTIIVIKNKRKRKDFTDPMYHHILINAVFNIIYCLIMTLKLVNTCIFEDSLVFCSSFYQTNQAQYFKIVCIHFLGNVFKLSSNISYLSFSFSRFILISNLKSRNFFKKFTNIRMSVYFVICILISSMLSLFKLFQYELNRFMDFRRDFPYESRDERFCQDPDNAFQCKFFSSLKILNKFLSDIVCVILIVVIDLCLLKNYYKHLENKLRNLVLAPDHIRNIQKSKKNINRMILWNSFIYLLAHLPEFVSTLLLIKYAQAISPFCFDKISCDLINEEAEFFSLVSMVGQFLIFLRFNKNFRASFVNLFFRRSNATLSVNISHIELKNLDRLLGDRLIR